MKVVYKGFTRLLLDNDSTYFQYLIGVLESCDELASLEVCKMPTTYNFRLIPSMPKYTNTLIQELTKLHNLFHLKLDLIKSIKSSSVIIYKIEHDG